MKSNLDKINARIESITNDLTLTSVEGRRQQINQIRENLNLEKTLIDKQMDELFEAYINGDSSISDLSELFNDRK